MITIALDAMGSDNHPHPEVEGAIQASNSLNIKILLVGNEPQLTKLLKAYEGDKGNIHIIHAPEVLSMSDHIQDARGKKNNSMRLGMDALKNNQAQAFVTAGNTGMAMYSAITTLGKIKSIMRPCLCGVFPVKNGKALVLDIGANAECRPEFLVQFAEMGSLYAQKILDKENPRIGLLSNGEEEGKGNNLVRDTHPLLMEKFTNFIGNVEGKELFLGQADVVVTDGFTGNVLLKSTEAVASLIVNTLRENLMSSFRTKVGALLAKPSFASLKKMLDPSEIGAAPLLGIDGLVFIGHGRSNTKAIISSLSIAKHAVETNLLSALKNISA